MFFVLSKALIVLLNPVCWLLIGFSIVLFSASKQRKKRAMLITLSLFLLLSNPFLLNMYARQWDIRTSNFDADKVYSCAILLGGFSSEGEDGEGFFNGSADRFIQGVQLKSTGKVSHLLITGGNSRIRPNGFRESVWVRDQLLKLNIADSSILVESKSRNTLENAFFTNKILKARKLKPPYLLVTSAFHMRRSLYTFNKAGIHVVPYSSNYIAGKNKITLDDFVPQAEVLSKWGVYLKELIGFGIYYVKS